MPAKSEPVYFWLCADCDFSVIGSAEEAAKHFTQKGCWGTIFMNLFQKKVDLYHFRLQALRYIHQIHLLQITIYHLAVKM